MTAKRRFKVQIANQTYTIIGKSTPEHMNAVVEIIEQQLAEIKEMMPNLDDKQAAILLAINAISDQLYKQEELTDLLEKKEQV